MKRVTALGATLALLLAPVLVRLLKAQSPAPTAQLVYTTVPSKNWVVAVDSATNSVVNTISIAAPTATGPGTSPASIAFTPDAKFAYVVNQGCDATGSTVSVIDTGQELVVATIPVPGCPHEIAMAPDGLHGYVTTRLPSGVGAVIVLDLTAEAVVSTVNLTSSDNPTGIAVSPTGDVVRFGKSDGIYGLATATNTLTSTVIPDVQFTGSNCPVGEIAGTPDGNFLLVTCFANEAVLLDAHTGRAISNALVSCTIGAPAITPDGTKAFVPDSECGGILDISIATGVSKLFFLPGSSGPTSRRIAFTSDGTKAFASGFYNCCSQAGQADVEVFNPANDAPIADVTVAFAPTSGSVGIAVMPTTVSTTTTVVSSVSPSAFGQQVSFTATVIPTQSSSLTPTGTVTFSDRSTVLGTVALSSGTAIFNTAGLAVGNHTITASYAGDNNFGSSTSSAVNQAVNQAATSTALAASPNPANPGQTVTFTATVTPVAPGAGIPTGTVTFFDGATTLGTVPVNPAGNATFSSSSLAVGSHSITAAYGGDTNFAGSSSSSVNQVVSQPATSTALAVSPNPANLGETVTFAATVAVIAPGTGTPTGTVTFLDGPTTLGIGVLSPGGTATLSTSSLGAGSHTVTASYGGDATFAGSTSNGVIVTVQGPPPPPVPIMVNETVHVTDAASFPDVFDPENVKVADAVWITPLIQVAAPVAEFSAGALGFSGQSGSQTITVSDIGTASLTVSSVTISGSPQFAITQIACSNSAASFSTMLPSGGACVLTIGYSASATPANDNGILMFTDNAALSNLAGIPAGSSFTQSISLSGAGSTTGPPPPPPAVIPIMDNETIHVTDMPSFPDVFDPETIKVMDAVTVTPLIKVAAPVAEFSGGGLGFGGQSGSQTIAVSDIGLASLTLASATISGSSQFAVTQISCTNGATSFSTVLPSGGACVLTIGYSASATPANDNATLLFTDNAALSNVASIPAGSSFKQSIPLNGAGSTTGPPPPPPAVIPIMDNETIHVTDTPSFPDVFDGETVKVADAVWITPLIQVSAPVAEFSAGALGFSGQSGSQTITVSDIGTASLTVASATISGSSQFSITQATCSNGATSLSTVLPSGGACVLTIGYSASATPANDNGILMFTDNAALSNLASIPVGSSFTQSIPLSGSGTTTGPPPPPPAVIPIMDNETIHVTDTPSFPDVFDPEQIHVTDQVSVIPCDFSISGSSPMSVPVGGSGSTPITITSVNGCNLQVSLTASSSLLGATISLPSTATTGGSSTSATLTVSAGPSVTPTSFTVTITGTSGLTHSASVSVNITASISGTIGVVQTLTNAGAINNVGIANALTSKLSAAQSAGSPQTSINTLKAFQNQVQAQAGQHIATSFTLAGVTFNPASTLMANGQALIDGFRLSMIPDPITGYVVNSSGMAVPGATVSIADATGTVVASATSDVTGFYFMATTGILVPGANYNIRVSTLPSGFTNASPSSQSFTWQGVAVALNNFVLN